MCQTKIRYAKLRVRGVQQHVVQLQVPVDDFAAVRVADAARQLLHKVSRHVRRQQSIRLLFQVRAQIPPPRQVHRQKHAVGELHRLQQADYVRVH
jgi:hypothetical protein